MLHSRTKAASPADPYARYRIVGTALALLIIIFAILEFWGNARHPADRDFISFWGAVQLTIAGSPPSAYDGEALHAVQREAVTFLKGGEMPFPYPPFFLLLVLPFGLLPFGAAMAAWSTATFIPYLFAARRMFPLSGLLAAAFPPVLVNASIGQNGFLTAAALIGGTLLLATRPLAAGLLLGCLVLKPQLGLLLPIALLAARQWRAIAGAVVSSVSILLVGVLLFGLGATQAWIDQLPLYARIARDGLVGWHKLVSVYAAARQAGFDEGPAFALHFLFAAAAASAVWRIWRSDAELPAKAAVLSAATMLASPYLFLYDSIILIVPFFWLAERGVRPAVLAPLWLLPIVSIAQAFGPGALNLNPLIPIVLLALILREATEKRSPAKTAHPAAAPASSGSMLGK